MAVRVEKDAAATAALATTLTRINPGDGVRVVWFNCATDCYLVYDNSAADGDALPSDYFRIPAGLSWPIRIGAVRPLVAAAAGTPDGHFLGAEL